VWGWLDQDGCSGFTPRLKKPVMVRLTMRVPSRVSQMPQSQLPCVSDQGSTTFGSLQLLPPSFERVISVWPLS
jgi:hypothetical protein